MIFEVIILKIIIFFKFVFWKFTNNYLKYIEISLDK